MPAHTNTKSNHDAVPTRKPSIRKASSHVSSTDTTDTVSARGSSQSVAAMNNHDQWTSIATQVKTSIDWSSVVLSARTGPGRWHRYETEPNDFAVYTRQESQRFGVLAVGLIRACTAEIVNVLQASNTSHYQQQMQALYEGQFQRGSVINRVNVDAASSSTDNSQLRELTVKSATFTKAGWFSDPEEWTYLDALYRDGDTGVVDKYMKSIDYDTTSTSSTKSLHSIVCCYLLRPGSQDTNQNEAETDHRATRVTFYAEFTMPKHVGISVTSGSKASDKAIKARLLKMAESTARLTTLVRRQRLAMQTLVNPNTFLPPTNTPCMVCTRILRIAKLCRLCGQGVCGSCSAKHERVSRSAGTDRLQVARIRVCANCMERVDQAEYSNLSSSSLFGPRIVPDSNNAAPASAVLGDLLLQALVDSPSSSHRDGVISVIKALAGQDALPLTTMEESKYKDALDHISIEVVPAEEANVRSDELRSYQLDMRADPTQCLEAPVPHGDDKRVAAVRRLALSELAEMPELSIICDVAAKEMGCSLSSINIYDQTSLCVVASNVDTLLNVVMPRNQGMCSHTIMENSAHIVPHPEADIRFSKMQSVAQYGVKYYCGYPLLADDGEILGSLCCINQESMVLTESQFATFKKLAVTAEKIVRLHAQKRGKATSV